MTFVEFILFIAALIALCFLMRPLQGYLETRLIHLFRRNRRNKNDGTQKPIIEIKNYTKKEK